MEAKLREYRARRRRQELFDSTKNKLSLTKDKFLNILKNKFLPDMHERKDDEHVVLLENEDIPAEKLPLPTVLNNDVVDLTSEISDEEHLEEPRDETWRYFIVKWSLYGVTWITLYLFFLKLQFGAVFFVVSCLIGIYLNTRTRPRKKGEISAYSVFNENCVSIDGTLKAEQLERELIYGPASIR